MNNKKLLAVAAIKASDGEINFCIYKLKEAGLIESSMVGSVKAHTIILAGTKAFQKESRGRE